MSKREAYASLRGKGYTAAEAWRNANRPFGLPWQMGETEDRFGIPYDREPYLYAADDGLILGCGGYEQNMDGDPCDLAEFIMRACNSHHDLVAAAQKALDFIQSLPYEASISPSTKAQDALVDALAKAKGCA